MGKTFPASRRRGGGRSGCCGFLRAWKKTKAAFLSAALVFPMLMNGVLFFFLPQGFINDIDFLLDEA